MRLFSGRFLGTVAVLSACSHPSPEPLGHASAPIAWVPAGTMSVKRPRLPAVVKLADGKVFIAGGAALVTQAELWDPTTKTFSSAGTSAEIVGSDAFLMPTGKKVFVPVANRGQLWDTTSHTFSAVPVDTVETYAARFVLLDSGKVLRTGGRVTAAVMYLDTCAIWDPALGDPDASAHWIATGSMKSARAAHAIVKLPDGKVLVAGGYGNADLLSSAEIYDPTAGTWSDAGTFTSPRSDFDIVLTPSGKAVAVGGRDVEVNVFDESALTWSKVAELSDARYGHATVVLGNLAYAIGGYADKTSDTLDLTTFSVTKTLPDLTVARQYSGAVALDANRILMLGGAESDLDNTGYSTAELLDPGASPTTDAGTDSTPPTDTGPAPAIDAGTSTKPILTGSFQGCHTAAECQSGFCVDGVCCDQKCDQKCHSCSLPSSPGKCTVEPLGLDLRAECGAARACTGTCGGDGTCIDARAGATCAATHCTGRSTGVGPVACVAEKVACDESAAIPFDCGPYVCEPAFGACRSFCTDSSQCADGYTCDVPSQHCQPTPDSNDSGGCTTTHRPAREPYAWLVALVLALTARRLWPNTRADRRTADRA
ncbi:MAG: Kelch repeat-containing protein [Polyangiales bacterium]